MTPDDIKVTVELESNLDIGEPSTHAIAGPSEQECWTLPRVHHRLREVKPTAYEPNAVSIGPYHYGKEHLRAMDVVKQTSFANIVKDTGLEFNELVKSMETLKQRALKCYEGPIHADLEPHDKFVEMMVLDGCFIIQLIRDMRPPELVKLSGHTQTDLWYDMLLLENQLPFFVLLELDRRITQNFRGHLVKFENKSLYEFFNFDSYTLKIFSGNRTCPSPPKDIKNLLDMVHKCCRPSPEGIKQHEEYNIETKEAEEGPISSRKFIRSACELDNAGIDFEGEVGKSLFDVTFTEHTDIVRLKFHNKVLKIPRLYICESTERRLRNLMAYEQYVQTGEPTYVSDYVFLMDMLINTAKDVQLLCTRGVIDNWLGDDEAVAQMVNKLRDSTYAKNDFYYAEMFDKVEKHCNKKWNKYKAKLKKDYFSSPWSVCSFCAAVILLVTTVLQTVYTIKSYYHPS